MIFIKNHLYVLLILQICFSSQIQLLSAKITQKSSFKQNNSLIQNQYNIFETDQEEELNKSKQLKWIQQKKQVYNSIRNGSYPFKICTHHSASANVNFFQFNIYGIPGYVPSDLGMAQTQSLNLIQQLKLGIRLFDIRIGKGVEGYTVSHTIGFYPLDYVIQLFQNLEKFDNNFQIMINIDHFFEDQMTEFDIEQISNNLTIFTPKLICQNQKLDKICQIKSYQLQNNWFNKDNPQELITTMLDYQEKYRNNRTINQTQADVNIIQLILTGQGIGATSDGGIKAQDDVLIEYIIKLIKQNSTFSIPIFEEQHIMLDFLSLSKLYIIQNLFQKVDDN